MFGTTWFTVTMAIGCFATDSTSPSHPPVTDLRQWCPDVVRGARSICQVIDFNFSTNTVRHPKTHQFAGFRSNVSHHIYFSSPMTLFSEIALGTSVCRLSPIPRNYVFHKPHFRSPAIPSPPPYRSTTVSELVDKRTATSLDVTFIVNVVSKRWEIRVTHSILSSATARTSLSGGT